MFTGIVTALGTVREVQPIGGGHDLRLVVGTSPAFLAEPAPAALGASIACSGVCLTVVHLAARCGRPSVGPGPCPPGKAPLAPGAGLPGPYVRCSKASLSSLRPGAGGSVGVAVSGGEGSGAGAAGVGLTVFGRPF